MVYFFGLFVLISAVGTLGSVVEKRTVAQVETDLNTISKDVVGVPS